MKYALPPINKGSPPGTQGRARGAPPWVDDPPEQYKNYKTNKQNTRKPS